MERAEVQELHFLTPLKNLPSIAEHGILSHELAARLGEAPESIANSEVQERRAKVRIPSGLRLHQYANLYFNARNPMMYCRLGNAEQLGVVSVDHHVLDLPNVVVTDQNAATEIVRFGDVTDGLRNVSSELTYARYWTDPDPFKQRRHKAAMCAEVLVPSCVPVELVRGVYVCSDTAVQAAEGFGSGLTVKKYGYLFFRGEP